jgi:secreted trypsin-like serine protease
MDIGMLICNAEYAGKVDEHLDDKYQRITGIIAAHNQFTWQVALTINNTYLYGGSLISSEWVLTAARCA